MPSPLSPKRRQRPKPNPEASVPSAQDWRSTDAQEILRRQVRAKEETMGIRNLERLQPVFSNFEVKSDSGMVYQVEIRDVTARLFSCTCADYRKNGLGTCKHVEAVLLHAQKKAGNPSWMRALAEGSPRVEIVAHPQYGLQVWRGLETLPTEVRGMFDVHDGTLLSRIPPEDALEALTQLPAAAFPHLRISQEVAVWLEARAAAAERLRLRHEYEQKVHRGEWPPQETLVPLFPYQREGMLHLAFKERALLADEMGLGKTIQAIAACALLHRLGKAQRVLIVTPASLKAEWEEQISQFTLLKSRTVFGSRAQRLAAYSTDAPFFTIVNYEQMVADTLDVNHRLQPDIIILDEAQRIKNWNTKTAQAIKRLESRYAFVLTGTPIENRIDELYSLLDFLDARVLGPLFRFNRDFYHLDDKGRPIGYRNLQELHGRIGSLMLRRRKAQVETELPDRTDRNHFVTLTTAQRALYATHEEKVAKLAAIAKRRPLRPEESQRLLRELAMMRMICDTPYILDPTDRHSPKVDELRGILEEALANEGVKIIIFSEWERMLELVRELCRELGADFAWHTGSVPQQKRRLEINTFKQDPRCRLFLSTDAGATGLNLQNASVVINCDLPWNPAKLEQRIARAWRKHQTRSVTVINLIAENTLEHRMLGTLADKMALAQGVLDEGTLDTMDLRGGRDSFFKRLQQLLTPDSPSPAPTPAVTHLLDPAQALAQAAAHTLGPLLWKCEERPAAPGHPPVCLMIVERDSPAALDRLRPLIAAASSSSPPHTVEVIDRPAYETLQRLTATGLLTFSSAAARPLHPPSTAANLAPPALTPAATAHLLALTDRAAHHLRLAGLLHRSAFPTETRAALETAVLLLSQALATAASAPLPPDLPAALDETALSRWEWSALTIQTLATTDPLRFDPLEEALRKTEARLRSHATSHPV